MLNQPSYRLTGVYFLVQISYQTTHTLSGNDVKAIATIKESELGYIRINIFFY